ncbi:unnamed protein product [Parnassius apollo]|uniref:(apollo) hypothetical protein n=1 Tax=Parnassius apollo TaxID=110799 RepID=A0A8S3XKH4_PARAO|nr:unnamed protein product [Parnassius apollo]
MGGNYEKAHNMDGLAQHQMSGLVRQVEGELGDGYKTRTGSVYTAANSRGIYGSGNYDLSNLKGRNFEETEAFKNSLSHSSIMSQNVGFRGQSRLDSAAYGSSSNRAHSSGYRGHVAAVNSEQFMQTDNLQSADNLHSAHEYDYDSQAAQYLNSGFQNHHAYDQSSANIAHSGVYGSNSRSPLLTATPVRVVVRPGGRIAIPLTAQTFDAGHVASSLDQSNVNSEAELLSTSGQHVNYMPLNTPKHYESSYSYRKQWEKHDTQPVAVPLAIPTVNPFPSQNELYDDNQALHLENQHRSNVNAYNSRASNSEYNANIKSAASSQSRYKADYNAQHSSSLSATNSNGFNAGAHTSNAYVDGSAAVADSSNLVELMNTKPKSYHSSYSYHKSWERQGDPYIIKPVGSGIQDGQISQRLTAASLNNGASYSSHQYGSKFNQAHQRVSQDGVDYDCDNEGHIRVARSYDTRQEQQFETYQNMAQGQEEFGQQTQNNWDDLQNQNQWGNLQDLGQQSQNQWGNLQDLGKHTEEKFDKLEDLGQQTQIQWSNLQDLSQHKNENLAKLKDLGQQTQTQWSNLQDLGQHTEEKFDKLEDLGQQTQNQWGDLQDLGQHTEEKFNKLEDLGQQTQNQWDHLQDLGQHTEEKFDKLEDLGQQTQNQWGHLQNLGQHTEEKFNKLEDLGQQTQNQWDHLQDLGQHTEEKFDKLEDLGQQTQNQWGHLQNLGQHTEEKFNKLEDLGQQTQNQWDHLQDLGQHTEEKFDKLEDLGQQTQNQWGHLQDLGQHTEEKFNKLEDLGQQTQNQWGHLQNLGQHTEEKFNKLEDLGQQTQNQWNKLGDLDQQLQTGFDKIHQQTENKWDKLEDLSQQTQSSNLEQQIHPYESEDKKNENKMEEYDNHEQQLQGFWNGFENTNKKNSSSHNLYTEKDEEKLTPNIWNSNQQRLGDNQQTQNTNFDISKQIHSAQNVWNLIENANQDQQKQFWGQSEDSKRTITSSVSDSGYKNFNKQNNEQHINNGNNRPNISYSDTFWHNHYNNYNDFYLQSETVQNSQTDVKQNGSLGSLWDKLDGIAKETLRHDNDDGIAKETLSHDNDDDNVQKIDSGNPTHLIQKQNGNNPHSLHNPQLHNNKPQTEGKPQDSNENPGSFIATPSYHNNNLQPMDIGRGDIGPEDSDPIPAISEISLTNKLYKTPQEIEALSLTKKTNKTLAYVATEKGNDDDIGTLKVLSIAEQNLAKDLKHQLSTTSTSTITNSPVSSTNLHQPRNNGITEVQLIYQNHGSSLQTNRNTDPAQENIGFESPPEEPLNMNQQFEDFSQQTQELQSQSQPGPFFIDFGQQSQATWLPQDNLEQVQYQKLPHFEEPSQKPEQVQLSYNHEYPISNNRKLSEEIQPTQDTNNENKILIPSESTTEKPGFWSSVGSKLTNAKDKVFSWFKSN